MNVCRFTIMRKTCNSVNPNPPAVYNQSSVSALATQSYKAYDSDSDFRHRSIYTHLTAVQTKVSLLYTLLVTPSCVWKWKWACNGKANISTHLNINLPNLHTYHYIIFKHIYRCILLTAIAVPDSPIASERPYPIVL